MASQTGPVSGTCKSKFDEVYSKGDENEKKRYCGDAGQSSI
jgi:hypothetical protein